MSDKWLSEATPAHSQQVLPPEMVAVGLAAPSHSFIHPFMYFLRFFATKAMAWVVCWLCVQSREDVHTYVYHMWIWESSLLCFSWTLKLKCHILKWIPCRNFKESGIDFLHKWPQFFTPSCIQPCAIQCPPTLTQHFWTWLRDLLWRLEY